MLASLYLISLIVGGGLILVSVFMGAFHAGGLDGGADLGSGGGADLGHGGLDAGHLPGHLGHGPGADAGADHGTHLPQGKGHPSASPLNFQVFLGFLLWFGGAGYVVHSIPGLGWLVSLPVAAAAGMFGGWLVWLFLDRILVKGTSGLLNGRQSLGPGTVGRLTAAVRPGGTGEMVYAVGGTRKVAIVRSDDGEALPAGEEVAVVRYEHGVAYIRSWRSFAAGEHHQAE